LANEIFNNGGSGVQVGNGAGDSTTLNNDIRHNIIAGNGALGIDLAGDGVTPNHAGFLPGPNNFQNYPELLDASSDGTSTTVDGSLTSTPQTDFVLEFFVNPALDPSGHGQGAQVLGWQMVTTDGTGVVSFHVTLPGDLRGQFLTATATEDPAGNTSEFSAGVAIMDAGSGPGTPGRSAAWALGQRAAFPSAPPVVLPQPERLVTEGSLPPADSVPFRYERPDAAAVDDFFGRGGVRSLEALRHQAAGALLKEDASFLGAGVWASNDW